MSHLQSVLHTLPRVVAACRTRRVADPRGGPGLSAHQAEILSYLDAEDPTMVGELAAHLGVTASTMSLTLKRMDEAGYVRRDRDPSDRRVTNVRLTEEGIRLQRASALLDPERVHRLLLALPPQERRMAVDGLTLLAEAAERVRRAGHDQVSGLLSDDGGDSQQSPTFRHPSS